MVQEVFVYQKKKSSKIRKLLSFFWKHYRQSLFLVLILFLFLLYPRVFKATKGSVGKDGSAITKLKDNVVGDTKKPAIPLPDPKKKTSLVAAVTKDLSVSKEFHVSIYDIDRNDLFGINDTVSVHAASVAKILVGTTALEEVEAGNYSFDTTLGSSTFKDQLRQMVNQSNNDSWALFNNLLGFKREQKTADLLGLARVDISDNKMSTKAVATLLYDIYKGKVLNESDRSLLLSYMTNTNMEDRIPAAVPKGVVVYHKWGAYNAEIHDAAIVMHPAHPFVLVIFTNNDSVNYDARIASIHSATKDVYAYFDSF